MKNLILVGGPTGVEKSAVCRELLPLLAPGAWLDGDWCWMMSPFVVSEESKRMVLSNIAHMLRAYRNHSGCRNVIFCWVMDRPQIFEAVLHPLRGLAFNVYGVSLVCAEEALRRRLEKDVANGLREAEVVERSVRRLSSYASLPTVKLDVTSPSPAEAAQDIARLVRSEHTLLV